MVVKVLIEDGIVSGVYMDEEAEKANIDVTVIDFDHNLDSKTEELVEELIGLEENFYTLTHCTGKDE